MVCCKNCGKIINDKSKYHKGFCSFDCKWDYEFKHKKQVMTKPSKSMPRIRNDNQKAMDSNLSYGKYKAKKLMEISR